MSNNREICDQRDQKRFCFAPQNADERLNFIKHNECSCTNRRAAALAGLGTTERFVAGSLRCPPFVACFCSSSSFFRDLHWWPLLELGEVVQDRSEVIVSGEDVHRGPDGDAVVLELDAAQGCDDQAVGRDVVDGRPAVLARVAELVGGALVLVQVLLCPFLVGEVVGRVQSCLERGANVREALVAMAERGHDRGARDGVPALAAQALVFTVGVARGRDCCCCCCCRRCRRLFLPLDLGNRLHCCGGGGRGSSTLGRIVAHLCCCWSWSWSCCCWWCYKPKQKKSRRAVIERRSLQRWNWSSFFQRRIWTLGKGKRTS